MRESSGGPTTLGFGTQSCRQWMGSEGAGKHGKVALSNECFGIWTMSCTRLLWESYRGVGIRAAFRLVHTICTCMFRIANDSMATRPCSGYRDVFLGVLIYAVKPSKDLSPAISTNKVQRCR